FAGQSRLSGGQWFRGTGWAGSLLWWLDQLGPKGFGENHDADGSITPKAPTLSREINCSRIHIGWRAANADWSSAFGPVALMLGVRMEVAVLQRRRNLR